MRSCRNAFAYFVENEANLSSHASGPEFSEYNPHGLAITTFAKFGPKVWRVAEDALDEEERRRKQWDHLNH